MKEEVGGDGWLIQRGLVDYAVALDVAGENWIAVMVAVKPGGYLRRLGYEAARCLRAYAEYLGHAADVMQDGQDLQKKEQEAYTVFLILRHLQRFG